MMCEKFRDELMEVVLSGPEAASPEMREHLRSCVSCTSEVISFQQTMGVLDEWQAPEASPYFSTRLRAQLREEALVPARGWVAWLRRPVLAGAAAVLVAVGVGLLEVGRFSGDSNTLATNDGVVRVNAPGNAVSDLQYLDKNADLFSDFDVLDGQSSTE
jgi:anti-sigma factor RsiW